MVISFTFLNIYHFITIVFLKTLVHNCLHWPNSWMLEMSCISLILPDILHIFSIVNDVRFCYFSCVYERILLRYFYWESLCGDIKQNQQMNAFIHHHVLCE